MGIIHTAQVMMKILIVEDNPVMRHLIRSIVSEMAEVFECEDGSEALQLYEQHQPDWVLMDIRMKRMGGIEATRRIRQYDFDARVIIVSNYDDKRLRETARTAGAYGYVLKEDLSVLKQILIAPP
jgi:two-component system, NarL family, response regulator DegU